MTIQQKRKLKSWQIGVNSIDAGKIWFGIGFMKINLELLNLLTGFTLLVVGIIDFTDQEYIRAASWIIFGSMYIVMDIYKTNPDAITRLQKVTQYTRPIFGFVGLTGSILLLIYRHTIY